MWPFGKGFMARGLTEHELAIDAFALQCEARQ